MKVIHFYAIFINRRLLMRALVHIVCLHNILIFQRQYVQSNKKTAFVYFAAMIQHIEKIEVYYTRKAARNDELDIKNRNICYNMLQLV